MSTTAASTGPDAPRLEVDDVIVVDKKRVRTAIGGTVVGNFMEWFDFGIYGYLAVTLAVVFTEDLPEPWGLMVTLFGFAVSFLVRPVGGLVLGPLGDRIGRQRVLFFTMALMAVATGLIGVLPTSAQIGLWAILPLYLLKMAQGFSTGGEYAGATTYVAEFSPDRRRGFWSSWLDVGSYVGFAAGASVVALTTLITESVWGPTAMVDFGWRIPFLLAIPLGAVAIWFRLRIPETPAYETATEHEAAVRGDDPLARHGVLGILRHHWRPVLIGIAIVAATNTAGYALTSYMPTYLEQEVGVSNLMAAVATVPVLIVMSACLPLIGLLSDRIGRRPVYLIAAGSTLVLMVPAFAVMQIGEMWAVFLALAMVAVPVAFYVAVAASALPALFPTASRFGAMAIAYNVSVSLFGGTTPLFSQGLIELTGNTYMPAFYIMFFALLGGIAMLTMKETAQRPLLGSVPAVETLAEAAAVVERQDDDPLIDTSTMPLPIVRVDDADTPALR
ncbi:MFS transporter [Microbacterium sp. zg.Y1090]|uniref:MFS transporter n=1 Tax=Microbacterium TaxID=33882 RepID=UPI00214BACD2|nr:MULTISPECIES: MFS transporter [unclassified Microbacterium]MCR2812635.1 MFS transporter [Microbacterium sp. zg.Y1084]MCR2817570.1 MFS transporter [Microbacterium sp. zg.Y1090]MDL5485788.1 MFS transporter [Microbacterium sp. zg-Y1211]WIM28951.1 MFS transporter [Microbacterium sp. zg-Y1090]